MEAGVGYLCAKEKDRLTLGVVRSLNRVREGEWWPYEPARDRVVAKVGGDVSANLGNDVSQDPASQGERGGLVRLGEQLVKGGEGQIVGEELVGDLIVLDEGIKLKDLGKVARVETADGQLKRLFDAGFHALSHELGDIDGPAQELEVPLLEDDLVPVPRGVVSHIRAQLLQHDLVTLLDEEAGGPVLVVHEDILGELEDKLVKGQVDLSLDLVEQITGLELVEGATGGIIVKVKWVENIPLRFEENGEEDSRKKEQKVKKYSVISGDPEERTWSVRTQGSDISMGN